MILRLRVRSPQRIRFWRYVPGKPQNLARDDGGGVNDERLYFMSGQTGENPYYISNISTNIYSIEELCYYLYHNIYLLDETIINEQLLVWMKEELHLRRLYQRLYVLLEEKKNIGEFILPIFKEINYLSHDQFREMNERLKRFEEQPEIVRKKIKGDYLVDHEKYINAIQVYQETLKDTEETKTTWEASSPEVFTTTWAVPTQVCSR